MVQPREKRLNIDPPFAAGDTLDAATGALLGACAGDAAGATLEFLDRAPSNAEVRHAMTMAGGGWLELAPGQITDDGELTLCLALALRDSDTFDLERIAVRYADWIRSTPFDVGQTTKQSLGSIQEPNWRASLDTVGYAETMIRAARLRCSGSKANGSLMRATPLGVWGHRLDDATLGNIGARESGLSHPNSSCRDAVACYTIAIARLVRCPGDRDGALRRAEAWAAEHAEHEVRAWLDEARAGVVVPYQPLDGFVRIAFTHAFRHLRQGSSYSDAIHETLAGGGDTDTNACIVGGLIGAACGARSIPTAMANAVLTCDTSQGRPRPAFLSTTQLPELIADLMRHAPAALHEARNEGSMQ